MKDKELREEFEFLLHLLGFVRCYDWKLGRYYKKITSDEGFVGSIVGRIKSLEEEVKKLRSKP